MQIVPQIEGLDKLLLTAMECAIIGLRSVNELFGLGAAEKIAKYDQQYHLPAKNQPLNRGIRPSTSPFCIYTGSNI